MGYKKTPEIPAYLSRFGLNAFEYQCGRGVRYVESDLLRLKEAAVAADIALSVHAPYYISLSSTEEEKRLNSVGYITDTAKAARIMGGDRIVVPFRLLRENFQGGSAGACQRDAAAGAGRTGAAGTGGHHRLSGDHGKGKPVGHSFGGAGALFHR